MLATQSTRADLESLLRARRLDRTLTAALSTVQYDAADSGVAPLDASLGGGFPRGHVSELVGVRSSGRTSLMLQAMAAATARGELVALVDALDMLDVESAAAAGVALDRLLWVRGFVVTNPVYGGQVSAARTETCPRDPLEQALRAFALILQAGNFGLVVFDVAEAPAVAIRRLPFTTWLRVHRIVEGSQTACLLVGSEPMARSAAGVTVRLGIRESGVGIRFGCRLFDGLDVDARIVHARARPALRTAHSVPGTADVRVPLQTTCA